MSDIEPHALLEYGDFECSFCGKAYREVKAVRERLGDGVRFEFRHFPLWEMHPHAFEAAQAAEAARAQGRFGEMHDLLFENQARLDHDDLVGYAGRLGLDVERFDRELRDGVHADKVRADRAAGEAAGVTGTPAFFIDGERYRGSYEAETLIDALRPPKR
jgi:protein-disulfide isomerase